MNDVDRLTHELATNPRTKHLDVEVVEVDDGICLVGRVRTYFQKQCLISLARKYCPHKDLSLKITVLALQSDLP